MKFFDADQYGLSRATVSGIDHLIVQSFPVARAWVADRFPNGGTVQVVFGEHEVCVLDTPFFLENWKHLFVPGRDDALVIHNHSTKIFLFRHENELEVGDRRI